MPEETLNVFNIERYRIHDGTGIRTAVFLKGCPVQCPWCANPESQRADRQMAVFHNICVRCGLCIDICPAGAARTDTEGRISTDLKQCDFCGKCVNMCPHRARKIYGEMMTVQQVMKEVCKDSAYYNRSHGGVTITGGEPLLQWRGVQELINECRYEAIKTTIETCGFVSEDIFSSAALMADELLIDVKTTEEEQLACLFQNDKTGINRMDQIKANLQAAGASGKRVVMRCPIIPGFNYTHSHIEALVQWAKAFGIGQIDLLPFHQYGRYKYAALDMPYSMQDAEALHNTDLEDFRDYILSQELLCVIGG